MQKKRKNTATGNNVTITILLRDFGSELDPRKQSRVKELPPELKFATEPIQQRNHNNPNNLSRFYRTYQLTKELFEQLYSN